MIKDLTDAYLRAVDEALPGFVEKLYVVGSAALGAWVPNASDVDTVIVTSRVASPSDLAALRRYNLENLRDFWKPAAPSIYQGVAKLPADAPVDAYNVAWCILGPARLHYTLAYQDITSKAGAAGYLAEIFPEWEALAHRAVQWRTSQKESFTAADMREVARSIDAVADDAWKRWGGQIA